MARLECRRAIGAPILLLLIGGLGCSHAPTHSDARAALAPPPAEPRPAPASTDRRTAPARVASVFEGVASYYGRWHAGKPTASGAPFRPEALTCAHRTLKFGTRLRVTNLENGRSTRVVVNDRGPFVRGRVLDLSLGAAKKLAMVRRGKAHVRVEVLR